MLPREVEEKLMWWIDRCGELAQPPSKTLTRLKAKRLYFSLHGIPITDDNRLQLASEKWWRGFKNRHPKTTTMTPTPLQYARAKATQPEIINHFYDLLKHQLDTFGFQPHQIWACDETGVAGDQKSGKAVGERGTNMFIFSFQILYMFHDETIFQLFMLHAFGVSGNKLEKLITCVRGHVSIMHICNANAVSLPPLYVFSGVKLVHNMLEGAPTGVMTAT